jgi:DNA repair exonuclease SbcCD ATPase subunit
MDDKIMKQLKESWSRMEENSLSPEITQFNRLEDESLEELQSMLNSYLETYRKTEDRLKKVEDEYAFASYNAKTRERLQTIQSEYKSQVAEIREKLDRISSRISMINRYIEKKS